MSQFQSFSTGDIVRELLTSTLNERRAASFPKADKIDDAIGLFIPADVVSSSDIHIISETIHSVITCVQRNAKRCGESVPSDSDALQIACRAATNGLLSCTHIQGRPTASPLEKLQHLCSQNDSLRQSIGTFVMPALVDLCTANLGNSSGSSQQSGSPENPSGEGRSGGPTSRALTATVDRLSMLVSDNPQEQADASSRILTLLANNRISESDLAEFETFATGGSKTDQSGNLIIRSDSCYQTSTMLAIIELLEDGNSPEVVVTSLQVSRNLNGLVALPDLADSKRVKNMSDAEYDKFLVRRRNLTIETLQDFCDEFGFDIEDASGLNEQGSLVTDEDFDGALGISQAIIFCIHRGEGHSVDDKVSSIIQLSRERPELNGDFERIMELFSDEGYLDENGEFVSPDDDEDPLREVEPDEI